MGFVLGTALAFLLGTVIALSRPVEYFLYPFVVMFQAMPKVALAPLIIVWFGLGLTSKVVNAALVAIFALIGAIVAEFVGAQAGLGMLIQSMNFTMDVAGQFSVLLLLSIIGLCLNWIVISVRKRVLFWDASQKFSDEAAKKEAA